MTSSVQELPRRLGLIDAVSIVVGIVIGAGIFMVPNLVARQLPSPGWILAVWAATGLLSFFGALAYAELGAMMPATGGQYVYLREAYGPLWAFLCGWTIFLVVQAGAIAWLSVSFSIYLGYFIPLPPGSGRLISVALIFALSVVNYRGVKAGAAVQNFFVWTKLAGLAILIGSAFLASPAAPVVATTGTSQFAWSQFGVAMIACFLSYEGWNYVSFVAGEIREPQKNLLRALAFGLGLCIAIYLLANLAYLRVLSVAEIAATDRVGALAAERTLGRWGGGIVSLTILLSIIGAVNGQVLAPARLYFAQARDGLFFRSFGEAHPRFATPYVAIVAQGSWAALLVLSGAYEALIDYAIFGSAIFFTSTVIGVIILRRKYPDRPRPYRMWGYPGTPLAFTAAGLWFLTNTIVSKPEPSLLGLLIIAAGVPIYLGWRRVRH